MFDFIDLTKSKLSWYSMHFMQTHLLKYVRDLRSAIIAIQVELSMIHQNIPVLCFLLIASQIPNAAFEGCMIFYC